MQVVVGLGEEMVFTVEDNRVSEDLLVGVQPCGDDHVEDWSDDQYPQDEAVQT